MSIKKVMGHFIRKFISKKTYRILRLKPLIVPSYYKNIIEEVENYINIQQDTATFEDEERAILLLRKQAHIIDKGLQRKDFKPGHSTEHYRCALSEIKKVTSEKLLEDDSLIWGRAKIKEFERKQEGLDIQEESVPSTIIELPTAEALRNLMTTRRSVRYFKEQPVPKDILSECIEVINWAPSSCNKQPIQVYTTNDPACAAECASNCKGLTGFSSYIPCFMAICVDTRGYVYPSEMYLPSVDASLGAENMLLMLHAKGLASTVLSWAQKDEEEEQNLRQLLDIPDYCTIIFNVVTGYPDTIPPVPERKSVSLTMNLKECGKK